MNDKPQTSANGRREVSTKTPQPRGQNAGHVINTPLILLAVTVFIDLLGFGIVLPNSTA